MSFLLPIPCKSSIYNLHCKTGLCKNHLLKDKENEILYITIFKDKSNDTDYKIK